MVEDNQQDKLISCLLLIFVIFFSSLQEEGGTDVNGDPDCLAAV